MVSIGDRVETVNFGWAEAVSDNYTIDGKSSRGGLVDVRFDNTGNVRAKVYGNQFKQGCIRDGGVEVRVSVGDVWNTNNHGKVVVTAFHSNTNIEIQFINTGSIYRTQKDQLLLGMVTDKPTVDRRLLKEAEETKARVNERARLCEERVVAIFIKKLEREKYAEKLKRDSHAKWLKYTQYEAERKSRNAQLLSAAYTVVEVDNDLHTATKGVIDVDFKDREGKWVLRYRDQLTGEFIQTRLGKLHNNMTQRGNKEGSYQNKFSKSYRGVEVSDDFKDPQIFCDWAVRQIGWGLGYQLDKDLLIEGNREYSAETCCFLPAVINTSLYSKFVTKVVKRTGDYKAVSKVNGCNVDLGCFQSEQEAEQVCLDFKKHKLTKLANAFKDNLDQRSYEKLTSIY